MALSDQRRPAKQKPAKSAKPAKTAKSGKTRKTDKPSRVLDSVVALLSGRRTPSPRGAPVIGPNLWLENQLRRVRDPADANLLYEGWLQRYYRDRGRIPEDPKRAFRQAVRGCWERIERG